MTQKTGQEWRSCPASLRSKNQVNVLNLAQEANTLWPLETCKSWRQSWTCYSCQLWLEQCKWLPIHQKKQADLSQDALQLWICQNSPILPHQEIFGCAENLHAMIRNFCFVWMRVHLRVQQKIQQLKRETGAGAVVQWVKPPPEA